MYKNIVRLFLQANACNQLRPLKLTIIRILESKHGPTYWIIEHADKMVKTIEQETAKNTKQTLPWGRHKTFLKTFSKSHNFVTFIFVLCNRGVDVNVATAWFSLTKGLNYWIMVKQGPKIQFNCYNIKTHTCFPFYRVLLGIISWNRSDKYLERRSVLVHIHGVCGLIPPFSVFISYTNPELNTDKRLIFLFLLCYKDVSVHVASALFSLTKGLNYLNHGKTWTENSVQLL